MRCTVVVPAILLLIGFGALTAAFGVQPQDLRLVTGSYSTEWVVPAPDDELTGSLPSLSIDAVSRKLVPSSALPRFRSRRPFIGRIIIPKSDRLLDGRSADTRGRGILLTLDESRGTGTGYDRLYVDVNRDGSLRDERVHVGKRSSLEGIDFARFSSIAEVRVRDFCPESPNANSCPLDAEFMIDGRKVGFGEVTLRGCWEGSFDTNQGKLRFRLADSDLDGVIGQGRVVAGRPALSGDTITFDFHGLKTGVHPGRDDDWMPTLHLTGALSIGDRFYTIRPTPLGDSVQVSGYDGPFATVSVSVTGGIGSAMRGGLRLYSPDLNSYDLPVGGAPTRVLPGSYRLMIPSQTAKDVRGREWRLLYALSPRTMTLSANENRTISLGGSMRVSIGTAGLARGAATGIVCGILVGEHGKLTVLYTDKGSVTPSIVLRNGHGRVVCRGTSKFG